MESSPKHVHATINPNHVDGGFDAADWQVIIFLSPSGATKQGFRPEKRTMARGGSFATLCAFFSGSRSESFESKHICGWTRDRRIFKTSITPGPIVTMEKEHWDKNNVSVRF
jgi:hypothetical protein